MPELPEVETVVRRIAPHLKQRKITEVDVLWKRTLGGPSISKFSQSIIGATIKSVSRRAKYILIELEPKGFLIIHLRMSGDLVMSNSSQQREKHLRVCLSFSDGSQLRFVDTRKFGRFVYAKNLTELLSKLGPEPIDKDFDLDKFYARLHTTKRPIKTVLLDQQMIAGLGNIYAVETLWRASIHPLTPARSLSKQSVERLVSVANDILTEAIEAQGTDLGDGVWKIGGFSPSVYGREGNPCQECGTTIKKLKIAQRSSEFCTKCQVEK